MREILFKAKRIDNGEWVEGWLIKDEVTGQCFIHASGNSVNESDKVNEEGCLRFVAFEVDESTICQYTGLTDKKGKKIWENDVVRDVDEDMIVVVRWDEEKLRLVLDYYGIKGCLMEYGWDECMGEFDVVDTYGFDDFCSPINESLEVIGTKFDNPELLGG